MLGRRAPPNRRSSARNLTAIASGPNSGRSACPTAGTRRRRLHARTSSTRSSRRRNSISLGSPAQRAGGTISAQPLDLRHLPRRGHESPSDRRRRQPDRPAAFVDAVHSDLREAAGSPTIDAGIAGRTRPASTSPATRASSAPRPTSAPTSSCRLRPPPRSPSPAAGSIRSLSLSPRRLQGRRSPAARSPAPRKEEAPGRDRGSPTRCRPPRRPPSAVERKTVGRRAGKRCAKATKANRRKKRCVRFVRIKGGFSDDGGAGVNRFRFSARLRGKALRPGSYRLVGKAGGATRRAAFRIVR